MVNRQPNKLRGVNLGGWLVLERWITPGLFEGSAVQDEYSFMQERGAAEKIEQHRQEFMTESDFAWLAAHGVNAVRIPVGYWVFDGDGPFTACISHLDWAVDMAEEYGLKVLIDLHAAKGSQNGKDHSGRIGQAGWYKNSACRRETIDVLVRLAARYRDSPSIWGIELLNEPSLGPIKYFILKRFYRKAYQALTKALRPGVCIVFSDGFAPWLFSGVIREIKGYRSVMDVHWYQFGFAKLGKYFPKLAKQPKEVDRLQYFQPIIVGEWSGMLSHKTLAGLPKEEQQFFERRHIARQIEAYSGAAGWFYWTYKTEHSGVWNFRQQVESGNLLLQ